MMWIAIKNWLSLQWLVLLKWSVIIGGAALVIFKIRESGRQAEKVENLNQAVKVKNAQLKTSVNAIRNPDDIVKRLRDGNF